MKLILLKGVNIDLSPSGCLRLRNEQLHGCAVFAPISPNFEFCLTAREDDAWCEEGKAGSYCLGIVNREDVHAIQPAAGDDIDDILSMRRNVRLDALSTGSFRFSSRLFDCRAWRTFGGSLDRGRSLIMNFQDGKLRYRLNGQSEFTDVTSYSVCLAEHCEHTHLDFNPAVWLFSTAERGWNSGVDVSCCTPHAGFAAKHMCKLWEDNRFQDCVIVCNDEQIPAHRVVLCAASPVFDRAFSGSMREAQDSRLEVLDCESPLAVQKLLEFMYKGMLPSLEIDTLIALLPLAVHYQVEGLCSITFEQLVDGMDTSNVRAIVKVVRSLREDQCVGRLYKDILIPLLKSDDELLSEALV